MSDRFDPFPDFEAICSQLIREELVSVGVYSSIPKSPTWPLMLVKRIGGRPAEKHRLDRARIQVESWGTSKSEALDNAQFARVALMDAPPRIFEAVSGSDDVVNGFLAAVEDEQAFIWLPDPSTARDRYLFTVSVYGHS